MDGHHLLPASTALIVPDNLDDLAREAAQHARESIAPSSRRNYETDWRDFAGWCAVNGQPSLPTRPEIIGLYLEKRSKTHKVSTLQRRLVSISKRHKDAAHHLDMSHPAIRKTFSGIKRQLGTAQTKKTALRRNDIKEMVTALPNTVAGLRDRALVLVGFAGAFRRSELSALDVADFEFSGEGVAITIRRSKTDQEGAGQAIGIPRGNGLCPVRALQEWLRAASIESGPIFRAVSRSGRVRQTRITDKSIAAIVKKTVQRIGLDPSRFAGHSLRSGFATSASAAGADLAQIMQQTRHKSEAVARGYVQRGSMFQNRAVRSLEL